MKKSTSTKKKVEAKKPVAKKTTPTKKKTVSKKTTVAKKPQVKKTTASKRKPRKKKAFTLIELLAVIIILGIVMIIAIPSVTKYIGNSRKKSYLVTAKNVVGGAKTKINSGELSLYDQGVTYYLPFKLIPLENSATSPYGDFDKAYVVVTYDKNGYDYYWTSNDTSKKGIYLTYNDELEARDVVSNVETIEPNIAICGREKIILFNDSGVPSEPYEAEDCINPRSKLDPASMVTEFLKVSSDNDNMIFGKEQSKNDFEVIRVVASKEVPANALESWDASENGNGSVMAWYTDENNNNKYELYIGQDGGVMGPPNSSYAFAGYRYVKEIDVSNYKIKKVTNMSSMFRMTGYNPGTFKIIGLESWDVSKVTDMSNMFFSAGHNASSWNIGNLSSWNTKNVTNMAYMFTSVGWNVRNFDISFVDSWDVSNVENMGNMFSGSGYYSDYWNIGDLSNWNPVKCKKMNQMFQKAGGYDAYVRPLGTLNIYADDIQYMFNEFHSSGTINIHKRIWANPGWMNAFYYSGGYTVNYTTESEPQIDSIIGSQGYHGRVVKGVKLY